MRNPKGFTLIEVLVSIAIFAISAAAIASLMRSSFFTEGMNANHTAAVALAQQEFEDLRSLAYDAMTDRLVTFQRRGIPFQVTTNVRADQPAPSMKEITVTVNWDEHGQTRTYAAQTIYTSIQR